MSPTKTRPRRSQRERREATTAKLLATARRLFARDGYTATSVEAIVRAAGMTKGAFFHHFSDKADVFAAVYEEEERKLGEAMTAAFLKKKDPWAGFSAGSKAFLEAAFDPGVQQIMLVDAPSVLGLERMRHIQGMHTFALMSEGLREAMAAGRIRKREVEPLANVLFGGMCQAVTYVLRADDKPTAIRKVNRELTAVLEGLAV
jgi:AcrR family transcriptional regulator